VRIMSRQRVSTQSEPSFPSLTEVEVRYTTAAYMRLHLRYRAVHGLLDLVEARASLIDYARSVDCKIMCLRKLQKNGRGARCSISIKYECLLSGRTSDSWWYQSLGRHEAASSVSVVRQDIQLMVVPELGAA